MARTKGAKDKRPRRTSKKAVKKATTKKATTKKKPPARTPAGPRSSQGPDPVKPPAEPGKDTPAATPLSAEDFDAAIARDLGLEENSNPGRQDGQAGGAGHSPSASPSAAPMGGDDVMLTRQAWEGVLRVPFRTLALVLQWTGVLDDTKGIVTVGKLRAKDLAGPSYTIFEHYAREYLKMNPDNPLSLAWAATGLVAADIAEQLAEVILTQRAAEQAAKQKRRQGPPEARTPAGEGTEPK